MSKYIDIKPEVLNGMFRARLVFSDYDITEDGAVAISIVARRNDGEYMTKSIVYPDIVHTFDGKDVIGRDYDDNVVVPFFGMYATAYAQIVGVLADGQEVQIKYGQLEGKDLYVRYDDSPVHASEFINKNKINLDFEVEDTHNPKTLRVVDQSEWGLLEGRTAVIEIKLPGVETATSHYLAKNQVNIFTSMTLGLNCEKCDVEYMDLPDGVYDITIKGSPSSYNVNRKYLKTDTARLNIDKYWIKANVLCEDADKDLIKKLEEAEWLLSSAEAATRQGDICFAHELMERLNELLEEMGNCTDCGHNKK